MAKKKELEIPANDSTRWWRNRELYTHIVRRDFLDNEISPLVDQTPSEIYKMIVANYPNTKDIDEKSTEPKSARNCYQADVQMVRNCGPYSGRDIFFLSPIWRKGLISPKDSYVLELIGGVVVPWLEPVPVRLAPKILPKFWFDGYVCRTIYVPGPPKLPALARPPKRFIVGAPPCMPVEHSIILASPIFKDYSYVTLERSHYEDEFAFELTERIVVRIPQLDNSFTPVIIPPEDALQNSFTLSDVPYIFLHPTIPPIDDSNSDLEYDENGSDSEEDFVTDSSDDEDPGFYDYLFANRGEFHYNPKPPSQLAVDAGVYYGESG